MNYTILTDIINVSGLVSAFVHTFKKGFHYNGERHNGWEFVFVDNGKIIADADDKKYVITNGELICHKPMEFHNLNPYQTDATAIIFCFYCESEKMSCFENKIFTLNQRQRTYLYDLVSKAETFFVHKDPLIIAKDGFMDKNPLSSDEDSQFIKNTIELLILSLFTSKSTDIPYRVNQYSQHLKRKTLTNDIKAYIENNIGTPISIKDISKTVSYSPSTVKTVFKSETGLSLIAYYNKLRLEIAEKMIVEKNYSISQITEILGFTDTSHFTNFFKKHTGISPRNYKSN